MRRLLAAASLVFSAAVPAAAQVPAAFTLTSNEVTAGRTMGAPQVFNGMGCTGNNMSPSLSWRGAPSTTKSFALTVYDPDAPTGSGWWHWVVYNISASAKAIPAGAGDPKKALLPTGSAQGNTDFGGPGYGGPCPPVGDKPHHYVFTLFALDADKLDLPAGATAAYVGFNVHAHTIGKATFTAMYGR